MKIPLVDVKAQYDELKEEIDTEVSDTIQASQFILGEKVEAFENAFARYCKVKHCIGLNSGTDAIRIYLRARGIQKGDEVITAAHTFIATAEPIVELGATPVFVDIDEKTYTLKPEEIEKAISPKTKMILPIHLYGQPAEMDKIMEIAEKRDVKVFEDACQAHGAEYNKKKIPYSGEAAFSFFPGKNLGAFGDAGILTTNEDSLREIARQLRFHGFEKKYFPKRFGYNSRMDGLQGAVLNVKLKKLDAWNQKRIQIAQRYSNELSEKIVKPEVVRKGKHVFHLYVIQTENRDQVMEQLNKEGIDAKIHYPTPLHKEKVFNGLIKTKDLKNTEKVSSRILSLPVYPHMTDEQVSYVIECVNKAVK